MKFNSPYAEAWKYLITYLLRPPNYTRIRAERRAVAKSSPALRADERKEAAFYSEVAAQPDVSRWEGPDEEEDSSFRGGASNPLAFFIARTRSFALLYATRGSKS